MPRKIDGDAVTASEDKIWKGAMRETGNGAIATAAVRKHRRKQKTRRVRRKKR